MPSWQDDADGDGGRPGLWTGLIALAAFVVAGFALAPGLVSHREAEPVPAKSEPYRLPPPAEPQQDAASAPLEAGFVAEASGHDDFDCMIQPTEVVDIGSAITGLIDSILVERGDYVEAGEVLAKLESHVEQAAVRVALANSKRVGMIESSEASLELGRKRHARAQELYASNSLSLDLRQTIETEERLARGRLKEAQEDRALAALRLEQARASLDRRTIRSPVSGYVVERLMTRGEVVDDDTILRVVQVDPLKVEVILPVALFGRIKPGDRAEITPEAPLDRPQVAEIAIVDRVIDGASATFGAQLMLPNPEHELPAGLRCRARFESVD